EALEVMLYLLEFIASRQKIFVHDPRQSLLDGFERLAAETFAGYRLINHVMHSLGPGVVQYCLNLNLATHAIVFDIFGQGDARWAEADRIMDRLVALVGVFVGRVMNFRLIPV